MRAKELRDKLLDLTDEINLPDFNIRVDLSKWSYKLTDIVIDPTTQDVVLQIDKREQ
jgi:hypothetical protein